MGGTEGDVDGDEDEGRRQRRRLGKGYRPWIMATKRTQEVLWTHRGGTPNPTGRLGRLPGGGETVLSPKGPGQLAKEHGSKEEELSKGVHWPTQKPKGQRDGAENFRMYRALAVLGQVGGVVTST